MIHDNILDLVSYIKALLKLILPFHYYFSDAVTIKLKNYKGILYYVSFGYIGHTGFESV